MLQENGPLTLPRHSIYKTILQTSQGWEREQTIGDVLAQTYTWTSLLTICLGSCNGAGVLSLSPLPGTFHMALSWGENYSTLMNISLAMKMIKAVVPVA